MNKCQHFSKYKYLTEIYKKWLLENMWCIAITHLSKQGSECLVIIRYR